MKTIGFCIVQQFLDLGVDHFPYCLCCMVWGKLAASSSDYDFLLSGFCGAAWRQDRPCSNLKCLSTSQAVPTLTEENLTPCSAIVPCAQPGSISSPGRGMRSAGGRIGFRGLQPVSGDDPESAFVFERIQCFRNSVDASSILYLILVISPMSCKPALVFQGFVQQVLDGIALASRAFLRVQGAQVVQGNQHSVFQIALHSTPALNTRDGWQNFGEFQEHYLLKQELNVLHWEP